VNDKSKYNPQIHHRKSIRLKGYDYAQAGLYFITICCENRICRFGEIKNGEMILNDYGRIAFDEWVKTPQLRPQIELDAFIVMLNHIHGILKIIGGGELRSPNDATSILGELHLPNNEFNSTTSMQGECNSPLRSPSQTVGAIVRGYK
jgi:putative transposase